VENLPVVLSVSVPTLGVLIGILIHNSRLSDLRAHVDVRFAGLENLFDFARQESFGATASPLTL
jgi:hypothetical protein